MSQPIRLKRGTAAQWSNSDPVLFAGEIGVETDTQKFKIGTGQLSWSQLKYFYNLDDATAPIATAVQSAVDQANGQVALAAAQVGLAEYWAGKSEDAAAESVDSSGASQTYAGQALTHLNAVNAVVASNDGLINAVVQNTSSASYATLVALIAAKGKVLINTIANIPAGVAGDNGKLFYATDTAKLYINLTGQWTAINIAQKNLQGQLNNTYLYVEDHQYQLLATGKQITMNGVFSNGDDQNMLVGTRLFSLPSQAYPVVTTRVFLTYVPLQAGVPGSPVLYPVQINTNGDVTTASVLPHDGRDFYYNWTWVGVGA